MAYSSRVGRRPAFRPKDGVVPGVRRHRGEFADRYYENPGGDWPAWGRMIHVPAAQAETLRAAHEGMPGDASRVL